MAAVSVSSILARRDERSFDGLLDSSFSSLNLLFANDAIGLSKDCTAQDVIATIQFSDSSGDRLCEVDAGRWGDADQPCDPRISRVPIRRVNFPIGETRELNVAIKFSLDGCCFGIDNDYVATRGRKPFLEIKEEIVTATIKLVGIGVSSEWVMRFQNPHLGPLQILSIEPS
jgi:hypothetical protein